MDFLDEVEQAEQDIRSELSRVWKFCEIFELTFILELNAFEINISFRYIKRNGSLSISKVLIHLVKWINIFN